MNKQNKSFKLGSYITFRGNPYMIVNNCGDGFVHILNPAIGNPSKRRVALRNCEPTGHRAMLVNFQDKPYLLTLKHHIVSLTTGKLMKWPSGDYHRASILHLAQVKYQIKGA